MRGYIYQIINKINQKRYIGQTIDIDARKYHHFNDLKNGQHHSIKLQRAYNKYGEDNFNFIWDTYEVKNEQELLILEQKMIEKYDSYLNGYNETWGGEGTKTVFSYHQACILYHILQRYSGINRYLSRYFNCDHTVIDNLSKNTLYGLELINENEIQEYIKKLNLKEENLKENYVPHNEKKLSKQNCFEILSIILEEDGYDRLLSDIFKINSKALWRLKKGLTYQDYLKEFNSLTSKDKKSIREKVKKKYDLNHLRLDRKRGSVKNPLTQEQVNYILENQKNKKQIEIANELGISKDRVSAVIHRKSYKDLIDNYYSSIT